MDSPAINNTQLLENNQCLWPYMAGVTTKSDKHALKLFIEPAILLQEMTTIRICGRLIPDNR